jgi:uncharacterized protein YndB with AHSA1/START domain
MSTLSQDEEKLVPEGRIERVDGDYVLAFDRQLDYPRSYIWSLLAEKDNVAKWLGTLDADWQLGHTYELDLGSGVTSGTVLQLNPPLSLQISWEDELGQEAVIEWRVLESDGGTLLQFRSRAEGPDFLTEGSAGWQTILDALAAVAAGRPADPEPGRWARLREAYARHFRLSHSMGTSHKDSGRTSLRFERLLDAAATEVWAALTEPDLFGKWLGPGRVELQTGGAVEFTLPERTVNGDVEYVLAGSRLDYTWTAPEGSGTVHWMLEPADGKTRLLLVHNIGREISPESLMARWHARLDALATVLGGGHVHDSAHRLEALTRFYQRVQPA